MKKRPIDRDRPVPINPIKAETEEERKLYEAGERNSKIRKESSAKSLLKTSPNDEESDLIHALWQRQLQYHGENCKRIIRYILMILNRPERSPPSTQERLLHAQHESAGGGHHATTVPKPPPIYDLWRLPIEADF